MAMRVALVQGGPDFEAIDEQVARLRRLEPERYQIEDRPTAPAQRRLMEALEALRPGDELCLPSLEALRLDAGAAAKLLLDLLERGVRVLVVPRDEAKLDLGKSVASRNLLVALAALHRPRRPRRAKSPPAGADQLLSDPDLADIRRLAAAGMSPRRIGLIYRRSPKCISEILGISATPTPPRPHDVSPPYIGLS